MSYLSINIDNLSNMISEYNNLIEALKGCGDILSQSIGSLSEFEFSGVDAEILREAWGAETYDKIPTIREVLESVKSALEDSLEEYKNCKKYNEEFIVAFDGYGDVCFSAEDMSGNVKCDTSMLADSSSYCAKIGDIKLDIATSIVSAKNMMAGLNKFQTAISQEIEDFSNLNSKLNQFSLHQFSLSKYSAMMTEADDNLYNKLNAKNFSFTSLYINDGYVPPAVKLMNYSPEVLRVATILAKKNPTADDYLFLSHVFAKEETLSREDYELMMKVIGETVVVSDDEPWNELQSQAMALSYKYAVNAEDTELLTMFFGYVAVKESDKNSVVHFDNPKMYGVLKYIDPHEDGMAYFTAMCSTHIPTGKLGVCAHIGVELVDGNLRLVYSPSGYQSAQYIDFIDMFETIPDGAYENMHDSWGMDDDEIVDFLSCFYSVEDIDKICELSCLEQGNEEQYNKFFAGGTRGITSAFYPALADYTYHLGEYGTEFFGQNLMDISNSILKVGGTETYSVINNNASFYFNALAQGYKVRFDQANVTTSLYFNKINYDNFERYGTLTTLFESQKYMYENGVNYSTLPGYVTSGMYRGDEEYKNLEITNLKINNNGDIDYSFEYDFSITGSGFVEHKEYPVSVFATYNDNKQYDDEIVQDMNTIKWDKSVFPIKVAYQLSKNAIGYAPIETYGAFDVVDNITSGKIGIPSDTKAPKWVSKPTCSLDVVYGQYKEYNSFDLKMQEDYNKFFAGKTGWRTGYEIGGDFVPLGNISLTAPKHYFVVINEPYSPQGYILKDEIANGFFTADLCESEKEELINAISEDRSLNESDKEDVEMLLFGGFDEDAYLDNHSTKELTDLYDNAFDVYDDCFGSSHGTDKEQLLVGKIYERTNEIFNEYYN